MKAELTPAEAAVHYKITTRQLDRRAAAGKVERFRKEGRWVYLVDIETPEPPAQTSPSVTLDANASDISGNVGQAFLAEVSETGAAIRRMEESFSSVAPLLTEVLQVGIAERARLQAACDEKDAEIQRLQAETDRLNGELARRRTPWWKRRKGRQ